VTGKPTAAGAPLMIYPRLRVKMAALSIEAYVVLNKVWLYCQDAGNGGRFHVDELPAACDRLLSPAKINRAIAELARVMQQHRDGSESPLWLSVPDDYVQMPEWWVDLNPGAEVWTDDTLRWRRLRNKELHSPKLEPLREKIRKRDRNLCRYCACRVKWGANNAPHGATYDHVDPDEGNTLSNVVVACRQCNGRKKDRTPQQWIEDDPERGLSMLPAGTTADQVAGVRSARAGPAQGSSQVGPESDPASRSRARPHRVEPESNRVEPHSAPASTRPALVPPLPDVPPPDDHDYPYEGEAS
jgi:hypothetical protein